MLNFVDQRKLIIISGTVHRPEKVCRTRRRASHLSFDPSVSKPGSPAVLLAIAAATPARWVLTIAIIGSLLAVTITASWQVVSCLHISSGDSLSEALLLVGSTLSSTRLPLRFLFCGGGYCPFAFWR